MRSLLIGVLMVAGCLLCVSGASAAEKAPLSRCVRPMHTFSIVARDSTTGEMGVAVQSHWFSVGAHVVWAEAGVGVVATQSFTEVSYGPLGLELMKAGKTAQQALDALVAADPQEAVRQVAMVDAKGHVAVHTGKKCIQAAGDHAGAQFCCEANLMEKNTVWPAMAHAYETARGDLAERLLQALEAAQREGGDIRGRQSAAILIVPAKSTGRPWADRVMDLRVEDSTDPIKELRRLVAMHRAYDKMDDGDAAMALNKVDEAMADYGDAAKQLPGNPEMKYWAAVTMYTSGHEKEAMAYFKDVFAANPKWMEVTRRLPAAGLLPDEATVNKILAAAPKASKR